MPVTKAFDYGVVVHTDPQNEWVVVEVRHLTPAENKGKHHIYVDAVDENGQRVKGLHLGWAWDGGGAQPAIPMDKPEGEPMVNIPMFRGQMVAVWMLGGRSDIVAGLHTLHGNEAASGGELWNTNGHHSFYIKFQKMAAAPNPVCKCCGREL